MHRPYGEIPEAAEVTDMARSIAGLMGMRIPDREGLLRKISKRVPASVYLRSRDYRLWIDRYYIAVEDLDTERVCYLYLTRKHIVEERAADLKAGRNLRIGSLDDSIRGQFAVAWTTMDIHGRGYAVRQFDRAPEGWPSLDFKAPWRCPA